MEDPQSLKSEDLHRWAIDLADPGGDIPIYRVKEMLVRVRNLAWEKAIEAYIDQTATQIRDEAKDKPRIPWEDVKHKSGL